MFSFKFEQTVTKPDKLHFNHRANWTRHDARESNFTHGKIHIRVKNAWSIQFMNVSTRIFPSSHPSSTSGAGRSTAENKRFSSMIHSMRSVSDRFNQRWRSLSQAAWLRCWYDNQRIRILLCDQKFKKIENRKLLDFHTLRVSLFINLRFPRVEQHLPNLFPSL